MRDSCSFRVETVIPCTARRKIVDDRAKSPTPGSSVRSRGGYGRRIQQSETRRGVELEYAERVRALYENRFDDLSPIPGEHLVAELGDTFVIQTVQDRRGVSVP
jgi:hypothetical protein